MPRHATKPPPALRLDLGPAKKRHSNDRDALKLLWGWRLELTIAIATLIAYAWLSGLTLPLLGTINPAEAAILITLALAGILSKTAYRNRVIHALHNAALKRAWANLDTNHNLTTGWRITRINQTAIGDRLHIRTKRKGNIAKIETKQAELAERYGVREVRVQRNRANAGRATAYIVRQDPFEDYIINSKGKDEIRAIPWPHRNSPQLDAWEPILIGMDEEGAPVTLDLDERNVLIGGMPGMGKSSLISTITSHLALSPRDKLWLLDGTEKELVEWAPIAECHVGPNGKDAIRELKRLQAVMDRQYRELRNTRKKKVHRDSGLTRHFLIIDELAFYMQWRNPKEREILREQLRDIVARGRAAGIIVIAATQKPDHEIVPTNFRDLFSISCALSCKTPEASDTILGRGWASAGYNAQRIPIEQRGVALLLAEGNYPTRIRTYYLHDDQVAEISSRALQNRSEGELGQLLTNAATEPNQPNLPSPTQTQGQNNHPPLKEHEPGR